MTYMRVIILILALGLCAATVEAQTVFTVTNTQDDGVGSLRDAIQDANANDNGADPDRIEFAIDAATDAGCNAQTGVCTIEPVTTLPRITAPVVIDGLTQPGADCTTWPPTLQVELDGTTVGGGNGLTIEAGESTVRGLVINRFDTGIDLIEEGGNTIGCNLLGTDPTGTLARANLLNGLRIHEESSNNQIGGPTESERNLMSGNNDGIEITGGGTGNVVQGNFFGTDVTGNQALPNFGDGVDIEEADGNTIGGTAGTTPGGPCTGACNLIAGNGDEGIELDGADENVIQGNLIGTDVSGAAPLGNTGSGIIFFNSSNRNLIGGTTSEEGNTIAFNGRDGLFVDSGSGNTIEANAIFSNTELGIDLQGGSEDNFETTANDNRDQDGGPNRRQNYPVLISAASGSITIDGALNSTPSETLTLAFYVNETCDDSGHGEGQTFLGTAEVTTDSSGDAAFSATFDVDVAPGQFVTATATSSGGSTSEFSACIVVVEQVNTAPVAEDDEATTPENTAVTIDVLANDTDTDGDVLTLSITTDPSHGEAVIEADTTITFTPDDGFVGADSLIYQIDDGKGGIDEATVHLTVTSGSNAPTAPQITSPADGAEVMIGGDAQNPGNPNDPFTAEWTESTDPDGDEVTYAWQLSAADNFALVLFNQDTGTATSFGTTLGTIDALLEQAGVEVGAGVTLFHRAVASDGQNTTPGPAASVRLIRGVLTATEDEAEIPATYHLSQNYPNPFNPETRIRFALPVSGEVRLAVYDVLGREVAVLVAGRLGAGRHEAVFEGGELPSGVYVYQLQAARRTLTRTMLLLK